MDEQQMLSEPQPRGSKKGEKKGETSGGEKREDVLKSGLKTTVVGRGRMRFPQQGSWTLQGVHLFPEHVFFSRAPGGRGWTSQVLLADPGSREPHSTGQSGCVRAWILGSHLGTGPRIGRGHARHRSCGPMADAARDSGPNSGRNELRGPSSMHPAASTGKRDLEAKTFACRLGRRSSIACFLLASRCRARDPGVLFLPSKLGCRLILGVGQREDAGRAGDRDLHSYVVGRSAWSPAFAPDGAPT